MPFTLAHTAAVLPLLRRRALSATGLLIGSMAPDFEKFARMGLHNAHSHSWLSIGYFSCPVGVLVAFGFHLLVRDSLLAHLPQPLYQRLVQVRRLRWRAYFRRHYARVLFSLGLGAATHLLWDAVTHRRPGLRAYLPALLEPVPGLTGGLPLFQVLEWLSSVMGVAVVLVALARCPRRTLPSPITAAARHRYWRLAVGAAAGLWLLRLGAALPELRLADTLISACSAGAFGIVVACLCYPAPPLRPAGPSNEAAQRRPHLHRFFSNLY
ncbi:DUF4184 family protein [Hymenobacter rigui]|uniref:DUF4184 family protein n=1 Tax=Hymenobacter rigui TaxID=334424 RepID=A0A428KRG2_9BACT|nr:DUF4184 family protein [Hymenobacter rigui]RSK49056.1 DUF4184 family protein [Hymenobacter rigui]